MRQHAYYPNATPTVRPLKIKLVGALKWLLVAVALVMMAALAGLTIARLASNDRHVENAFMQGMFAGSQLCGRGN